MASARRDVRRHWRKVRLYNYDVLLANGTPEEVEQAMTLLRSVVG